MKDKATNTKQLLKVYLHIQKPIVPVNINASILLNRLRRNSITHCHKVRHVTIGRLIMKTNQSIS